MRKTICARPATLAVLMMLVTMGLGCDEVFGPEEEALTSEDAAYLPLVEGARWTYAPPGGVAGKARVVPGSTGPDGTCSISGDGYVYPGTQTQFRSRHSGYCRVIEMLMPHGQEESSWQPWVVVPTSSEFWELEGDAPEVRWGGNAPFTFWFGELLPQRSDVTVPAGVFKDCIVCEVDWTVTYPLQIRLLRYYLAPGVGIVKAEEDAGGPAPLVYELQSYAFPGPGSTAPTACFTVSPTTGPVDTQFQVDASCSSDDQDPSDALEVRWDWESDGTWDTAHSPIKTAVHPYETPGTKTITLEVRDTEGLTGTTTRQVTVSSITPPQDFVLLPPGTFTMGSPTDEPGRGNDETQHQVTLTKGFYVSAYEVTQNQWQTAMGWNESTFSGPNRPVEKVTWFDAVKYCNERSVDEGLAPAYTITGAGYSGNHIVSATVTRNPDANGYRLLTEAEWEYASRAGGADAFCNGTISERHCGNEPHLDQVGWYCGNASNQTHDVGTKSPNAWGIYDMHGNVGEWCWEAYGSYPSGPVTDPASSGSSSGGLSRGGSWTNEAQACRSAVRDSATPSLPNAYHGLRVARTAD